VTLRVPLLAAGLAVAACTAEAPPAVPGPEPTTPLASRAAVIGQHMRAALACGIVLPRAAQDRAAAIETAALDQHHRQGGPAARDAFLAALAPPDFAGDAGAARQRAAWCARERPDVERVSRWLQSPEGTDFAARLAAGDPE